MFFKIFILLLVFLVSLILLMLNFIFSKKMLFMREKKSNYECGFDSFNLSRLPFSIHFFLIGLIFLIFDIELSMLFPFILLLNNDENFVELFIFFFFILLFILGLLLDWIDMSMEWLM